MFSVSVRAYHGCRCETRQQSARGCVQRHLREDEFQQSNKQDEVQKSITNISETHRFSNVQLPPHPTPTCFYSSNPVQQAHRGTHAYMFTCTLISTGLCRHVTNQGYRWTRLTPACTWAYWVHVCVLLLAFSWSRRRRAAQRPQAPCRRGR